MHMNSAQHTWKGDREVNTEAFPVLQGHFPTHDQTRPIDQQMSCKNTANILTLIKKTINDDK